MPTVAELERLEALVSRLLPLTNLQRGELIRAQDWNTLVGALIEVLRAVLAENQDGFVEEHEHPDQVTSGWLSPSLRSLIERGPLADPAVMGRMGEIERRIDRQTDRLETVLGEQENTRTRLSDVSTADQTRQANLIQLQRTVEGMVDAREEVLDLRNTLGSIQSDIHLAVEASNRFVLHGQPVDMEAIDTRIRSLEGLRNRLTRPDGSLLDASALEVRFTELTNTLVTQDSLDQALKTIKTDLTEGDRLAIEQRVRTAISQDIDTAVNNLRGEIRTSSADTLAQVDSKVSQEVTTATGTLEQSLLSQVEKSIASAIAGALPGIQDSVLAQFDQKMTAALQNALPDIQANVLSQFRQELTQAVRNSTAEVTAKFEESLGGVAIQLRTEFNQALEDQRGTIPTLVNRTVQRELGETTQVITTRLDKIDGRLIEHDRAIDILRPRLIADEVTTETPKLVKEQSKLRQELTDVIQTSIKTEIDKLNRRLPQLIKKQIDKKGGSG